MRGHDCVCTMANSAMAADEGGPARRETRMNTWKNHAKQPEVKVDQSETSPPSSSPSSPPLNHLRISRTRTGGFKTTLTMNGATPTTSTNSQVNDIATIKKKGSPIETGKKKKAVKKGPQRWISMDCRDLKCKTTPNTYVLLVRNLPPDVTKEQLEEHFRKTGPGAVKAVRIPKEKGTDQTRGIAYVEFKNKISQKIGLRLHHTTLSGNQINVEFTSASGKAKRRRKKPAAY